MSRFYDVFEVGEEDVHLVGVVYLLCRFGSWDVHCGGFFQVY